MVEWGRGLCRLFPCFPRSFPPTSVAYNDRSTVTLRIFVVIRDTVFRKSQSETSSSANPTNGWWDLDFRTISALVGFDLEHHTFISTTASTSNTLPLQSPLPLKDNLQRNRRPLVQSRHDLKLSAHVLRPSAHAHESVTVCILRSIKPFAVISDFQY